MCTFSTKDWAWQCVSEREIGEAAPHSCRSSGLLVVSIATVMIGRGPTNVREIRIPAKRGAGPQVQHMFAGQMIVKGITSSPPHQDFTVQFYSPDEKSGESPG